MQRSIGFLVAALILGTMAVHAQRTPSRLRISADIARFRGPDDSTASVELYYSLPQGSLTYVADSGRYSAGLDLTVFAVQHDTLVYGDRWLVPSVIPDTAMVQGNMNLVGVHKFTLAAGDNIIRVLARDRNAPTRRDSLRIRVSIHPISGDRIGLSDLELATSIKQQTQKTMYYKNTLEVIPSVGGLYSSDQMCFCYLEAYNLLLGGATSDYILRTSVFDAVGREIFKRDRVKKRHAESSVLVDQLALDALHSGTYQMMLSLLDTSKKVFAQSGRKFFVYNASLGVDSTLISGSANLPLSVLSTMDEAGLDEEFRQAKYEALDVEQKQYKQLQGTDAKKAFLSAFWRRRAAGFRDEYMERVQFANANYGRMGRAGYQTDRGRVYIMYGPADDYERHPSDADAKPHEIWTFNSIQGGVLFVFVQRNSIGDYDLVHSTHRNELRDDNWQQYVYSTAK